MDTKEILKKVKLLELKVRKKVNDFFVGSYHSHFKGQGLDFEEFKEYEIGDDIKSIDWNVSARFNKIYTKKYIEERELTLMLVVDISSSMIYGSIRKKIDLATEIVAIMGFSALKNQDKVGLILFDHKIKKFIPPKKKRSHVLRIIREIFIESYFNKGKHILTLLYSF